MKVVELLFIVLLVLQTSGSICNTCIRASVFVQKMLIGIAPERPAREVVQAVCERQYESTELCKKVSEELTPLAITMGVRGVVKTGRICEFFCPEGFYKKLDLEKEVEKIISDNSETTFTHLSGLPVTSDSLKVNLGKTKLLHMTDVHLDLNYTVNSSIVCDFPICCHAEHGFPETQSSKAPEYGSPKCDAPLKLFDSTLDYIKDNDLKVDAAVITGDYSAHNEWEKSPETVIEMRKLVEGKLDESLQVPLISAPGNNQYLPDHQVDPTAFPEQAVKVVDILSDNGKTVTFVIVNTLFCDNINLYLIQDQTMALRQIKTLNQVLEEKESVFLLGHIEPTSKSCSEIYGTLFRAVVAKHSKKIKGQFYGHTHRDQFVVNTDPRDNTTATSFGLLAGSLTPLGTSLPRFRIFELNNDFQIINYDDYSFSYKTNKWGLNYNFKQYYGLPLDQPVDAEMMRKLQEKVIVDPQTALKYNKKASLKAGDRRHSCETFDVRQKEDFCIGESLSFRDKIEDLLNLVQGPWGSYGSDIQ